MAFRKGRGLRAKQFMTFSVSMKHKNEKKIISTYRKSGESLRLQGLTASLANARLGKIRGQSHAS